MNLIELLKEAFDRFTGQIPDERLLENFLRDYGCTKRVIARVPGFEGKYVCRVIGEDEKNYALSVVFLEVLKYPLDYVMSYAPEDAPREDREYTFTRKKSRCIEVGTG